MVGGPDQSDATPSRRVIRIKHDPDLSLNYTMTVTPDGAIAVAIDGQTACG